MRPDTLRKHTHSEPSARSHALPRNSRKARHLALAGLGGLLAAMVLLAPKPVRAESGKLSIDRRCVLPAQMVRLDGALERTRARIDRREPLTIVAIGSSSTEGYGASSPANTYPAQLGSLLRTRYVGEPIEVINKGRGGEVATQTLARFGKDDYPNDPTLVIWQAGANDVVRNVPLEQFAATLKEGLAALRSAGIDVILMPPQYAPQTAAAKQIEAYVELIEQLGDEFDVPVVQRYELMQQLAAKDAPLLAAMLTSDGLHQNDLGYHCLAAQVAMGIDTLDAGSTGGTLATTLAP
ncbi:MAG TPA: SGNH/GDSL hydrolase family protein [Plasticicumulans sp.]|nr:SGNH/GDSL hydrolase family protein [Plasticicumulans sp.]